MDEMYRHTSPSAEGDKARALEGQIGVRRPLHAGRPVSRKVAHGAETGDSNRRRGPDNPVPTDERFPARIAPRRVNEARVVQVGEHVREFAHEREPTALARVSPPAPRRLRREDCPVAVDVVHPIRWLKQLPTGGQRWPPRRAANRQAQGPTQCSDSSTHVATFAE